MLLISLLIYIAQTSRNLPNRHPLPIYCHTWGLVSTIPYCVQKAEPTYKSHERVLPPANRKADRLSRRSRALLVTAESSDPQARHWTSRLRRSRPPSVWDSLRAEFRERAGYTVLVTVCGALLAAVAAFNKFNFLKPASHFGTSALRPFGTFA